MHTHYPIVTTTSFSIHLAAYVASFVPLPTLKLSTPLIKPIVPIEIKSSVYSPVFSNFLTICATSRKLCSINLLRADSFPCCNNQIYFFSSSLDNGMGERVFLRYDTTRYIV